MPDFTRRQAIASIGAGIVAAGMTAPAIAAKPRPKPKPKVRIRILPQPTVGPLDTLADALLAHVPETATYNGVPAAMDGGAAARRMDDYSPAGEAAWRAELASGAAMLAGIRTANDPLMATRLAVAAAVLANGTRSAAIPYGRTNPFSFSGHAPYLVTQVAGPHIDTVNAMASQQSVATPRAVDAWIEKLDGFRAGFAGVVEKLRADGAAGCRPPRALMARTLPVLDAFLAGKADEHVLIRNLDRRMAEAGLSIRMRHTARRRAVTALKTSARPAIAALRTQVAAMLPDARAEDGLWAQPDGEAFYAANVRSLGDTPLAPAAVHQLGLDEVARITAEMEVLLGRQGLTQGSVGARMDALAADPINRFHDDDDGRDALLDYVRGVIAGAEAYYPELLPPELIPRQHLAVRRVPVASQDGAPGGYYDGPSLDGSRPGIFWINLRDMKAVPRFSLPTLSYHEGVPGHHAQGSIATALPEAPLLIRIASFNAYQEGWALYAERLMAELGVYETDPLGDLGRLQAELFRSVRLVVDTGLHHARWSRETAIAYMRDTTGSAESAVTAEIERYMAWPGQALGYKLGQLRLLELREAMRAAKRRRFSLKDFHRVVLNGGAMPLDVVAARIGDRGSESGDQGGG